MSRQQTGPGPSAKTQHKAIVVGVDGSAHNDSAVAWAVAEAERTDSELVLVSASNEYLRPVPMYSASFDPDHYHGFAVAAVGKLIERINTEHPSVRLRTQVKAADACELILDAADDADLVVVGKRGLGAFARFMLGSTSIAVAGRASCPTVIVPDSWDQRLAKQPVLIGIDVHRHDVAALQFAFECANKLKVSLIALYGWETHPAVVLTREDRRRWGAGAIRQISVVIEPWRAAFPDVAVEIVQSHAHPAFALLEKGKHAQLIVLGRHTPSRRLGGLALGSISRAVLHYSAFPVAVVPEVGRRGRQKP